MTKNYQDFKIIIDLLFVIIEIIDKLIFCEIIHEIKNSFNHLFINTIFNLKIKKKLKRWFKRNWKVLNKKKFITMILSLISLIYFKDLIKDDEWNLTLVASHRLMMNLTTILTIILTMTCAHILNWYEHNIMRHAKRQQRKRNNDSQLNIKHCSHFLLFFND